MALMLPTAVRAWVVMASTSAWVTRRRLPRFFVFADIGPSPCGLMAVACQLRPTLPQMYAKGQTRHCGRRGSADDDPQAVGPTCSVWPALAAKQDMLPASVLRVP